MEPQKIRTFLVSYNLPEDAIREKDLKMHQARVVAGLEKEFNATANSTVDSFNKTTRGVDDK